MRCHVDIPYPYDEVWDRLRDMERVAAALPAATVELVSGERVHGRLPVRFKGMRVTYRGTLVLRENGPGAVAIEVNGAQVRGSGTVEGTIRVRALPMAGGTRIEAAGRAGVSGRAAELSADVLDGTARRLVEAAVERLIADLGAEATAPGDARYPHPPVGPTSLSTGAANAPSEAACRWDDGRGVAPPGRVGAEQVVRGVAAEPRNPGRVGAEQASRGVAAEPRNPGRVGAEQVVRGVAAEPAAPPAFHAHGIRPRRRAAWLVAALVLVVAVGATRTLKTVRSGGR